MHICKVLQQTMHKRVDDNSFDAATFWALCTVLLSLCYVLCFVCHAFALSCSMHCRNKLLANCYCIIYNTHVRAPCLQVSCSRHYMNRRMMNRCTGSAMRCIVCQSSHKMIAGMREVPKSSSKAGVTACTVQKNVLAKQGCKRKSVKQAQLS